jgi:putative protease
MNLIFPVDSNENLEDIISKQTDMISAIIGFREISRYFKSSLDEAEEYLSKLKQYGVKTYLQWDILMTDTTFAYACSFLSKINLNEFAGIRVQDPGTLYWLKEKFPEVAIHYIVETGNHNMVGLNRWLDTGANIKRFVLSAELSFDLLKSFRNQLSREVELEVQALGRVLLFYTPRALLTPLGEQDKKNMSNKYIEGTGTSEESPHKGFPLIENMHGTFMFNTKDIFIFDELEKVSELHTMFFRCDSHHLRISEIIDGLKNNIEEDILSLKKKYPVSLIKGFFKTNKTDVLFKKLKNSRIQGRVDNFLGEIVDVKKKKHAGLFLRDGSTLSIGDIINFTTPEGKVKELTVNQMKNGAGHIIEKAQGGQVVFFPPIGGISVRTIVKKVSNDLV